MSLYSSFSKGCFYLFIFDLGIVGGFHKTTSVTVTSEIVHCDQTLIYKCKVCGYLLIIDYPLLIGNSQ